MTTPQAHGSPIADLRRNYALAGLAEDELKPSWWQQFSVWFTEAVDSGDVVEPNAMVLGTVSGAGVPSARTVLLKGFSEAGFVFFSNRNSRKGAELAAVPLASLVFPWIPLERQVVVAGSVRELPDSDSDDYFASRPRGSQLGAWASRQSSVVAGRAELVESLAAVTARYEGVEVPRPPHWGGFLVVPVSVEFWQGRPSRMHDRLVFTATDGGWDRSRLAP